jgi:methylated-DNA-[protein]-cysteine S-methyltransferase
MAEAAIDPGIRGYCLFETGIGVCGVAWSDLGLTQLQLPEADAGATERRLRSKAQGTPAKIIPPRIARLVDDIKTYAAGDKIDFGAAELDLTRTPAAFAGIYAATRQVAWGQTATYGDLARRIGVPGAARVVGQAMGRNPVPIIIPCHRILASGGKSGGFSAHGGVATKARLLELEGVRIGQGVKADNAQQSFAFEATVARRGR